MDLAELHSTWLNGNLTDAVEAIIKNGKMSDAIEFALMLGNTTKNKHDRQTFLRMLRNRDN